MSQVVDTPVLVTGGASRGFRVGACRNVVVRRGVDGSKKDTDGDPLNSSVDTVLSGTGIADS